MDFSEAGLRPYHTSSCRRPSCLLGPERFLSPYICHHALAVDVVRFNLCVENRNSLKGYPIKCVTKGQYATTSRGQCYVVWVVEADLLAGQLLYITGDPIGLGCWDPDMAILMSPTGEANLWKTEVKIASGMNFRYNYFIKEETWPSCDITWRPGPEFSLSVPLTVKHDRKIVVRDSWMRFKTRRSPDQFWGSWMEETPLPVQPSFSDVATDEDKIAKGLGGVFSITKPFFNNVMVEPLVNDIKVNKPFVKYVEAKDKLTTIVEDTISSAQRGSSCTTVSSENDQPVEEPWLPQSLFRLNADVSECNGPVEDDKAQLDVNDQHFQVPGQMLPETRAGLILKEDFVSTLILINSSICTMQRIAVLEDEKLVELLLEPVKSNVLCDSVYLGVVTKLVPHMGGAFVNIGNSRHSLMDIKQNREPFIFPPFRQRREKEIGASVSGGLEGHPVIPENEDPSDDVEVIDDVADINSNDDSVQFMHNDYEENEIDDDFDVSEVLKDNINGSEVDYVEEEADIEESDGREQHLEGKTMNGSLPVKAEAEDSSGYKTLHPPDMKDSNHLMANEYKWAQVRKNTKIVVQVVKEGLGTKGPTLTAYPRLKSRFWILLTRYEKVGVSKKIIGLERTRLKVIAKTLQPQGFGLTVRTVAAGHSLEELQKDLEGLLSTWKNIMEHAKSAALAADEGVEGAIPVILHRAMGQTLSVVQDYFSDKVDKMVVDSPRTYYEVTNYLQDVAPDLCDRVELYSKRIPLFDEFNVEGEINNLLSKRVPLANGGSLVIEQTEALVSIDVNGGHGMLGHGNSQEKAVLDVNLAAAKQIARELRLRDIGGIIVVDFIDMADESNKRLVYEEVKSAVERDRSMVKVSELSRHGLMEITRKRVRPSVTFMISEPCICCHATGRVEALETSFSKIEQEICRMLAMKKHKPDAENPKSWPKFILRVDHHMCNYLTSGKRTKLAILSSSLKVWILLKVARGFSRGTFEVKPFTGEKEDENHRQRAIPLLRSAKVRPNNSGRKVTLVPIKKRKANGK